MLSRKLNECIKAKPFFLLSSSVFLLSLSVPEDFLSPSLVNKTKRFVQIDLYNVFKSINRTVKQNRDFILLALEQNLLLFLLLDISLCLDITKYCQPTCHTIMKTHYQRDDTVRNYVGEKTENNVNRGN